MLHAAPIVPLMGLSLLTAAGAVAQEPDAVSIPTAVASATPAMAPEPCGSLPAGAVHLRSDEFEIDVRVNPSAVHVKVPRRLSASTDRPAVRLAEGMPRVPIALNQITAVRAAHRAGALRVVLGLAEAPGPRADASCADARVDHVELFVSDVLFASAHRPARAVEPAALRVPSTRVRIGALLREPACPPVPEEVLKERLIVHSERCAQRADRAARGAVMLEFRSRGAGVLQRPVATVDELQRPAVVFCLINSIFDDQELARTLPDGAHFYAPIYFTPDAPLLTDQPVGH